MLPFVFICINGCTNNNSSSAISKSNNQLSDSGGEPGIPTPTYIPDPGGGVYVSSGDSIILIPIEASNNLEPLIRKYPNYKENSVAREYLDQEIRNYFRPFSGKQFPFIEGFPLVFKDTESLYNINDKVRVVFTNDPESYFSKKWNLHFAVFFDMSKVEASKLNSNARYFLSGRLVQWQVYATHCSFNLRRSISLGTFSMDDVTLTTK